MDYNTAYNKIIDAYFKDEIKPTHADFCFCGTLCDNTNDWYQHPRKASHGYTGNDLEKMEIALMSHVPLMADIKDEEKIFKGMCAALEVLKQIHKERGENVDEEIQFKKRELVNQ